MTKCARIGRSVVKWAGPAPLFVAASVVAGTEVADSSASGFTSRDTAMIAAPPAEVYTQLVKDVGRWWNPEYTYSRDAKNLSIDDRAGGLFLEKLPQGGSVLHMTLVYAAPGKALRLLGGRGPLQALGVSGSLTWELKPAGAGTQVDVIYSLGGHSPGGLQAIAPLADKVLDEQLQRLKAFVEKK